MAAAEVLSSYQVLGIKHRKDNPCLKYIYLKPHRGGQDAMAVNKTLFVAGLPLGFGEDVLMSLFTVFGAVDRIAVHPSQTSALVMFGREDARDAALAACKAGQIVELPLQHDSDDAIGLKAWLQHHKSLRPGNDELQKQLDKAVAAYEEQHAKQQAAAQAALADDGWTVVTRGKGRAKTDGNTFSGGVAAAAAAAIAAAKQPKQATDFYRFQQREKRRNEMMDLRQRFEEDRRRVAQMRSARRFKPY